MKRWKRASARLAGAILLCLGSNWAAAQDPAPEDRAGETVEKSVEEEKEVLDEAVARRSKGNDESVSAQRRIDEIADETDELVAQYRTTLKQIEAIEVYNEQMKVLRESQQQELASLRDQLDRVEIVGRSVTPLMLRMIDTLDRFIALDVPFLVDERKERVAELRNTMHRSDVTTPEKYRLIMDAYQIENEYGRTIEAYRGTIELDGRETTVDFLRFGRIALVYQSLDQTQTGLWDRDAKEWKPVGSEYRPSIRDGLRIARKQAAPDLVRLPLPAATQRGGES